MGQALESFVRHWARPLALTIGIEFLAVGGTVTSAQMHPAQTLTLLGVILVAISAGVIVIARQLPVLAFSVALAATAAYLYLANPQDSPHFLGTLVVAYQVGGPTSRVRTSLFALATVVLLTAMSFIAPVQPNGWTWSVLAIVVVSGLAAGQLAAELRAKAERRERESREEEARRRVADERLRIARELHDVVSHSISMINVQAGVAVHVMDERPEQARAALVTIKAASHDALRDLRDILGVLRDTDAGSGASDEREPSPRLDRLADLVANVRRSGVDVTVVEGPRPEDLPAQVELAAYRVIQEALTNVVRHAPGASARVELHRESSALVVEVENAVSSRAPAKDEHAGPGVGLLGMRERVRAVGGDLETGRTATGGFKVTARLPLQASA